MKLAANWMRRRSFRVALRRARAWKRLHEEGRDLDHFFMLEKIPRDAELRLPKHAFIGLVPPRFSDEATTMLRQVLYINAMHGSLQAEMMVQCAGGKAPIAVAAPAGWRRELQRYGMKVDARSSMPVFLVSQLRAFVAAGATLRRYIRKGMARRLKPAGPYVVFSGVRPSYLPDASTPVSEQRWDWLSWYARSSLADSRTREIWAVIHEPFKDKDLTGIRTVPHPLPDLSGFFSWASFFFEVSWRFFFGMLRWVAGGWWVPFVLPHAIDLAYARRIRDADLPLQVGFNSVEKMVRPLWTHEYERRGVRIIMYLYSMNNAYFIPRRPELPPCAPEFCHLSWNNYAVWSETHARLLRRIGIGEGNFITVGAMGFADDPGPILHLPPRSIAVFDVDSQRVADLGSDGTPRPYWDSETCYRFLADTFAAIRRHGGLPVYKPKVPLAVATTKALKKRISDVAVQYGAVVLDANVNSNRIIEKCDASISMPFTSTAAAATARGRLNAYYDPTGSLAPFSELACGVPMLLTQAALDAWLEDVLVQAETPMTVRADA